MYVVLEDGWMLRRTEREVFTLDGWRKITELRIGDKVKNARDKFVKVVEFT
jgi:hypothetical protein